MQAMEEVSEAGTFSCCSRLPILLLTTTLWLHHTGRESTNGLHDADYRADHATRSLHENTEQLDAAEVSVKIIYIRFVLGDVSKTVSVDATLLMTKLTRGPVVKAGVRPRQQASWCLGVIVQEILLPSSIVESHGLVWKTCDCAGPL